MLTTQTIKDISRIIQKSSNPKNPNSDNDGQKLGGEYYKLDFGDECKTRLGFRKNIG